jgi:hypothetical protein
LPASLLYDCSMITCNEPTHMVHYRKRASSCHVFIASSIEDSKTIPAGQLMLCYAMGRFYVTMIPAGQLMLWYAVGRFYVTILDERKGGG